MILYGGRIHSLDLHDTYHEAIAVDGHRIAAVGDVDTLRREFPDVPAIDLHGAHVYPAFVDAHAHPIGVGEKLLKPRLEKTKSKEEVYPVIRPLVGTAEWLISRGWDQNAWPDKTLPNRSDLDLNVSSDEPIALTRIDGHALWCNSAALERAGIARGTTDPAGGAILRDAAGEPTGILLDEAMKHVEAKIPPVSASETTMMLRAGLRAFLEHGVTTVHEMGVSAEVWEAYQALYAEEWSALPRAFVFLDLTKQSAKQLFLDRGASMSNDLPERLHFAGIKLYLDGALGSRGANLFEDYSDDPGNRGLALMDDSESIALMSLASRQELQIAVHAIGDRACSRALDLFERAGLDGSNSVIRIEHAQIIRDQDIRRMAQLGVYAVVQPAFYPSDRRWADSRLGRGRMKTAYRWRTLINGGVRLVASSDAPVEEPDVLDGIRTLTTRDGVADGEELTNAESLRAYAQWPHQLTGRSATFGQLAPGFNADLTVTDREPGEPDARVLATILDGALIAGSL